MPPNYIADYLNVFGALLKEVVRSNKFTFTKLFLQFSQKSWQDYNKTFSSSHHELAACIVRFTEDRATEKKFTFHKNSQI